MPSGTHNYSTGTVYIINFEKNLKITFFNKSSFEKVRNNAQKESYELRQDLRIPKFVSVYPAFFYTVSIFKFVDPNPQNCK